MCPADKFTSIFVDVHGVQYPLDVRVGVRMCTSCRSGPLPSRMSDPLTLTQTLAS